MLLSQVSSGFHFSELILFLLLGKLLATNYKENSLNSGSLFHDAALYVTLLDFIELERSSG